MVKKQNYISQVDAPIRKYKGKTYYFQNGYTSKKWATLGGELEVEADRKNGKESSFKVFKSPKYGYALYMR